MLLAIPDVLTRDEISQARQILETAEWVDGRVTAGHQSSRTKDNLQIPEGHPAARQLGEMILNALGQNPLFISAALPARVFPPLFNRYQGGHSFGTHVDNAIRQIGGTGHRIRTDLSATLFLTHPDEYDGGELMVETTICHEIHKSHLAVVIDNVSEDKTYACHHTPAMYGFQSYISIPIWRKDGSFFGTLCAIDPKPAKLNNPQIIGMFNMYADLISFHLSAIDELPSFRFADGCEERRFSAGPSSKVSASSRARTVTVAPSSRGGPSTMTFPATTLPVEMRMG